MFGSYDENKDEQNDCNDGVDENTQPIYHKWKKFMSFKPDIPETPLYKSKPMISKHYNKETEFEVSNIIDNKEALDLTIRLKALDDGYQFLSNKSAPESRCSTFFNKPTEQTSGTWASIASHRRQPLPSPDAHDFGLLDLLHNESKHTTNLRGETGPCWSWWMSVLKECIGDNPNLLFISDRHLAIALAAHNEFLLAFHVGFAAVLAVLITEASQSRQNGKSESGFTVVLAVLITGASQSRQQDTLMRLPMDIRLKIDLVKSVGVISQVTYRRACLMLALEGFPSSL
ncbi:hypothetical protein Tco_0276306 [Tanacetum coccineum]